MKFKKFLKWRKLTLPFMGILFALEKWIPFRDKRLWLFGCWQGEKYDDNSKYLFEYVNRHGKKIRCVWISRSAAVVEQVRKLGYEAYRANSFRGIWTALRCGIAVMTNGLEDFGMVPLVGGAKIVALWHGVGGFKKIYNENYSGTKLRIKKTVDFFFNWVYRDLSLATSEYTVERIMEQFGVKRDSIVITGQPRNDLFRQSFSKQDLLPFDLNGVSKVVLYMPTYRVNPQTGEDVVGNILKELNASADFNRFLEEQKIRFLVKLHPLTRFKMEAPSKNWLILEDKAAKSVQHLLMAADVLVSDYSSCCVDYALLNRPIVFYVPDESEYLSYSSVNDAYFRIVKEKAQTVNDLIRLISLNSLTQTERLNALFEDKSIKGSCYSENMYRAICREFSIDG